jgi:hypothetical protein
MSNFSLSSSTASSSIGSRASSALGATPAAAPLPSRFSVPARPPGLDVHPGPSNWSDEVDRFEAQQGDTPTSPQSGASTSRAPGHTAPPRRAPQPEGAIDPDRDYEYEEEDVPKRSTADAMKDMFDSAPGVPPSVRNNAGLQDLEEEDEEDGYLAWHYPQAVRTATRDWTPDGGDVEVEVEVEVDPENPWDGHDAPRQEPPIKVNIINGVEVWICPKHGATCSPGICAERGSFEAMRRRAKEYEERQEAKNKRLENRKKREERRARKLAQEEGREDPYDLPPHFASHRFRGARGSTSESEDSNSQLSGAC